MARKVIDGDSGEETTADDGLHCFIVRVDDDQFEALLEHQAKLARALRRPVSRAAAARELFARVLPSRRRRRASAGQLGLFTRLITNDPRVLHEASEVAARAKAKVESRR